MNDEQILKEYEDMANAKIAKMPFLIRKSAQIGLKDVLKDLAYVLNLARQDEREQMSKGKMLKEGKK